MAWGDPFKTPALMTHISGAVSSVCSLLIIANVFRKQRRLLKNVTTSWACPSSTFFVTLLIPADAPVR